MRAPSDSLSGNDPVPPAVKRDMSEMNQCSELQRYAEDLERREGAEPAPGLLAHMDDCEECREELQQVRRVAARMLAHQFEDNGHGPHLTDLEMATFATEGLGGPGAGYAVEHLADCSRCRRQFSHIRRLLEQHEDLIYGEFPRPVMPDRSFLDQVRLILSDASRLGCALAGFASWVFEWAMLLIVLFQFAAGYLAASDEIGRSAATRFLGVQPFRPVRFWLIAVACVLLAVFFRWLGAQLYHRAISQHRG